MFWPLPFMLASLFNCLKCLVDSLFLPFLPLFISFIYNKSILFLKKGKHLVLGSVFLTDRLKCRVGTDMVPNHFFKGPLNLRWVTIYFWNGNLLLASSSKFYQCMVWGWGFKVKSWWYWKHNYYYSIKWAEKFWLLPNFQLTISICECACENINSSLEDISNSFENFV